MEILIAENELIINSTYLQRDVTFKILIPESNGISQPYNLLLLNDGQEAGSLRLKQTLEDLYEFNRIKPVITVAIYAGEERLQEYGTADRPDFKKRGSKAGLYTDFVKQELLPYIKNYTGIESFAATAFAGFSLGGLSALDIAWNNPNLFNKAGVFSGSLWWRSRDLNKGYTDADRIMHGVIRNTRAKPQLQFWLQTGTEDETSDRNHNGIIDSVDDTVDLMMELENKGYTRPDDIQYIEVVGGRHNTETWAKVMPKFLVWAFGK